MSDAHPAPAYDLPAWRRRIAAIPALIPLANCSHAPLVDTVRLALDAYRDGWDRDVMNWDDWMDQVDRAKAAFAALINADPGEIAMTASVSAAAAGVASALDPDGRRRTVLLSEAEFPTLGHVWLGRRRHGIDVRWVPLTGGVVPLAAYDERIDATTLLVCACHAYYVNGSVQDLRAIAERAHAKGAYVFSDAYQTAGVRPIDVRALGVDFLASGAHKFLLGAPGLGFLYVRRELLERLEPSVTGWFGRDDIFAFDGKRLDWPADARRFETATPPVAAAYAARAGLSVIHEVGVEAIRDWTTHLSSRLIAGARRRGLVVEGGGDPAARTPTTAIVCEADTAAVERRMRERGIVVAARAHVIRLAPHFFNTEDDVDAALDHLSEILRDPPA